MSINKMNFLNGDGSILALHDDWDMAHFDENRILKENNSNDIVVKTQKQ